MNIILTTRCNKNCSFCFARQAEQTKKDMALADFQRLIELAARDHNRECIKLLGGEPTLHPEFVQMLDFLQSRHLPATLISNLLYTDQTLRARITRAAEAGLIRSVLANAAELTAANLAIFKQNYLALIEASRPNVPGSNIAAGITISRHKSTAEEVAYLDFLAAELPITLLRLSLDFLVENRRDEFFINNKEYGQKILAIIHKCLDLRLPMSWDCKLYPCLFTEEDFQKDISGFLQNMRTICHYRDAPFDIFPDMSYIHCYPARALSGTNILRFQRISEAQGEIAFLKKTLRGLHAEDFPPACADCRYQRQGQCDSLCPGCRELDAAFL